MATTVAMKHKDTGALKPGYFGFSWTTLFFGFFPALFRGDFITFIGGFAISVIIAIVTQGIGVVAIGLVWAFIYNKYYTQRLLERGYVFSDTRITNAAAAAALDVAHVERPKTEAAVGFYRAGNDAVPPTRPPGGNNLDADVGALERLASLRERGHITQEEFDRKKGELLGSAVPLPGNTQPQAHLARRFR